MDKVLIRGLSIDTVIGIYDWEKQIQQNLLIDLDIAWNTQLAAQTDEHSHALCYEKLSKRLQHLVTEKPINLIETVADIVANCVMSEFGSPWVRVKVFKPCAVPNTQTVGIEIERGYC